MGAGSDDAMDFVADLNGLATKNHCGTDFHAGFIGELIEFMETKCWKEEVAPVAASDKCAGDRIVVGHSLGAAIADAAAYCANRKGGGLTDLVADAQTFTVTGVYTFGAPGLTKEPLRNDLSRWMLPGSPLFQCRWRLLR